MYYGDNTFAIDLRTPGHRLNGYIWANSLSADAVESLRKLRISTEIECECDENIKEKSSYGYKWHNGKDSFKDGVSFMVSINRSDEQEPFGVSMG